MNYDGLTSATTDDGVLAVNWRECVMKTKTFDEFARFAEWVLLSSMCGAVVLLGIEFAMSFS